MRTILLCMIAVGALACATTETKDPTPGVEPAQTEPATEPTPAPEATPPAAEPAPATP